MNILLSGIRKVLANQLKVVFKFNKKRGVDPSP